MAEQIVGLRTTIINGLDYLIANREYKKTGQTHPITDAFLPKYNLLILIEKLSFLESVL